MLEEFSLHLTNTIKYQRMTRMDYTPSPSAGGLI